MRERGGGSGKKRITMKIIKCTESGRTDHMTLYMCTDLIITHIVCHDAQLVQRGLAVEEDYIAINQVTLNDVPIL